MLNLLKTTIIVVMTTFTLLVASGSALKVDSAWAESTSNSTADQSQQIFLIANASVKKRIFTRREIRAIFTMRLTQWPGGHPITVFVINDDRPAHIQFCKNILNIFPHQLRAAWNKLEFSGTGQGPIELSSQQEMQHALASTPGSIGYLNENPSDASLQTLEFR